MINYFSQKFREMKIISALCQSAERYSKADGQGIPAAEHFVMAAFELPDGAAKACFHALGHTPADFADAVARQYDDALEKAGIAINEPDEAEATATEKPAAEVWPGLYRAQPSGDQLMQALANARGRKPLDSADILLAAGEARFGVVPRAFKALGIDRDALLKASR